MEEFDESLLNFEDWLDDLFSLKDEIVPLCWWISLGAKAVQLLLHLGVLVWRAWTLIPRAYDPDDPLLPLVAPV